LLVARRSTLRQIGPLPPVAPKVSHFFSFGKDCRYPDEPAGESTPENEAAARRAETKFGRINLITLIIAFAKSSFLLSPLPPTGGEGEGEGGGKNFWQRV
jgi:hypothetical protein